VEQKTKTIGITHKETPDRSSNPNQSITKLNTMAKILATAESSTPKAVPHSRRTAQQVLESWRTGDYTPHGYLFSLLESMKASGLSIAIDSVPEFCKIWEIDKRAFYRAKAKLVVQGRLEEKIIGKVELRLCSKIAHISSDKFVQGDDSFVFESDSFVPSSDRFVTANTKIVTATPLKAAPEASPSGSPDLYRSSTDQELDLSLSLSRSSPIQRERDLNFLKWMKSKLRPTCKGDLTQYVNVCLRNDSDRFQAEYQEYLETRRESPQNAECDDVEIKLMAWEIRRQEILHYWPLYPEMRSGMRSSIEQYPEMNLRTEGDLLLEITP